MGIFTGKHALVLGGSGGIGRAVSLGLASRGAALTIHGGNSPERLENTLAEARKRALDAAKSGLPEGAGGASPEHEAPDQDPAPVRGFLHPIQAPVEEAALSIREKALKLGGPPDILVLAWGPFRRFPLEETKPEDWRFLVESNLIFPGILISGMLCDMINNKWGRILLFGGTKTAEIRGFSASAAYSAAKTALGVLAKSAAKSAGKAGVTCNVLCPGLTDTEYTGQEEQKYNRDKSPGGKALKPEDIARAALGILENPAVNGSIISVDGGIWV
jgi:NAD(P)-dependent dehydrogenase (short-subunit alcohol dehydrogenase family)